MKKINLVNGRLRYSINVYDGNLHEMPQKAKHEFDKQMFAAAHVPTDLDGIMKLNSRLAQAMKSGKGDQTNVWNIHSNLLSGLYQQYEQFSCKSHAFYCLIEGVTNFDDEHAKAKMKMLYSHGLNEFNTNEICEDVKKKLIKDYEETLQASLTAQSLIEKFTP